MPWMIAAGCVVVVLASLLMAVALLRGSLPMRRALAAGLLAALALFAAAQLAAPDPLVSPWLPRQLPLLLLYATVAAAGVATRRAWGRWLAGAARLVVGRGGRAMRDSCRAGPASLARARGRRGGLVRAGVLLSLAAIPYLLMLALGDGTRCDDPDRQLVAWLAALLLGGGAALAIRGRTVGVAITFAGALATAGVVDGLHPVWILSLLPAGAGALLAAGAVIEAAIRARGRRDR
jgi:hypothetical protein